MIFRGELIYEEKYFNSFITSNCCGNSNRFNF